MKTEVTVPGLVPDEVVLAPAPPERQRVGREGAGRFVSRYAPPSSETVPLPDLASCLRAAAAPSQAKPDVNQPQL